MRITIRLNHGVLVVDNLMLLRSRAKDNPSPTLSKTK